LDFKIKCWKRRRVLDCFFLWFVRPFQVNFLSSVNHTFWVVFDFGKGLLFKVSDGHSIRLKVKFIWIDFDSFSLIFYLFVQRRYYRLRWYWTELYALMWSWFEAKIAVSSAYVAEFASFIFGMSYVSMLYNI